HVVARFRFYTPHPDVRPQATDGDRGAAEQAAAAAGGDDEVEIRHVGDELQAEGPLAGDHRVVVERRHQCRAFSLHETAGDRLAVLAAETVIEDDGGAVAAGRRHLG